MAKRAFNFGQDLLPESDLRRGCPIALDLAVTLVITNQFSWPSGASSGISLLVMLMYTVGSSPGEP